MIMDAASLAGGKKAHGAALVWSELLTFKPEHDPERWAPVFCLATNADRVRAEIMLQATFLGNMASTWREAPACFTPGGPS
jgi:hypothetical protein